MAVLWEEDNPREITSAFKGITTPVSALYDQIHQRGWQVTGIKHDAEEGYEATATNPHGEQASKVGRDEATALGALLLYIVRREFMRQGAWNSHWADKQEPIAQAYAKAPLFDPKAAAAWKELADDSLARAAQLSAQLQIEVTDDPHPYTSPQELWKDVTKKQHLFVSRAASDHPVWTEDQVIAFRIAHNVLGHAAAGGDFGWTGTNLAAAAHMPYLSPTAQQALFTETVGRRAYDHYYHGYGPTKITFLDDHFNEVANRENPPGHGGEPTNFTLSPGILPQRKDAGLKRDPNYQYDTGIDPAIDVPGQFGDPLNYRALKGVGHELSTGWAQWNDPERQKQAIINAFRVALLSPLKELKWNAAHYQDLSQVRYDEQDPKVYWDALERARIDYNRAQGHPDPEIAHMEHYRSGAVLDFYRWFQALNPDLSVSQAKDEADRTILNLRAQIEEKVLAESKDPDMDIFEPKVNKELNKALKRIVKDDKPIEALGAAPNPYQPPGDRYGGFIGRHLIAIAKVAQYADHLLEAALEDTKRHDGAGHMFRAMALSLNIPYVGPKVASFAWLLLQPLTSQLATVDTHIADVLGYKGQQDPAMNKRDYFRLERELQAGRDASGYSHVPLGLFQWGMWDIRRHGQSMPHQDHSALRVSTPTSWRDVEWQPSVKGLTRNKGQWEPPPWWEATQPYRDAEKAAWNVDVAPYNPKSKIPWQDVQMPVHIGATQRYFHFAPREHRQAILDGGLTIGNRGYPEGQEPGVYMWNNLDATDPGLEDGPIRNQFPTHDLWEVNGEGLQVHPDTWYDSPISVFSRQSIPAHRLRLIEDRRTARIGGKNEVHLSLGVPEHVRTQITTWLGQVDLNMEPNDPEDYHITVAYAKTGLDNPALRGVTNRFNLTGLKFEGKRLTKFDDGAIVIELSNPYFDDLANDVQEWLIERGVEVSRYSPNKPHITVGHSDEDPPRVKLPPLSFRAERMTFSTPRALQEDAPPHRPLAALLSASGRGRGVVPVREYEASERYPGMGPDRPFVFDGTVLHLGPTGGSHAGVAHRAGFFHDWAGNHADYTHGLYNEPTGTTRFYAQIVPDKPRIMDALTKRFGQAVDPPGTRQVKWAWSHGDKWVAKEEPPKQAGLVWSHGNTWMKMADYQGWTNWHTWHVALMMDNEQRTYNHVRNLMKLKRGPEDLQDYLLRKVIGPYNAQQIKDAQEWNSIPEEERLDPHWEELKEKNEQAADIVDALGFGEDVSDTEPNLIDPELVNWQEIYDHLREEMDENDNYEREEAANKEKYNYFITGHDANRNAMYDAWLTHHVGEPTPDPERPWRDLSYNRVPPEWPLTKEDEHEGYTPERWHELRPSYKDKAWQAIYGVERGTAAPDQYETMQRALQGRGYTPEQIEEIMQTRYSPEGKRLQAPPPKPPDPSLDQPGELTLPPNWTARIKRAFRRPKR